MFSFVFSFLTSFILRQYLSVLFKRKSPSYTDSTCSLGFVCTSLFPSFFISPSQILFFLYFSLFACFPHHHNLSCFPPSYMPWWCKLSSTRWGFLSVRHYNYLYSFLSVDMSPRNLVFPWKTQLMACNSILTISIIPHCFQNGAISICSHIKWNWWPVWRPDSDESTVLPV